MFQSRTLIEWIIFTTKAFLQDMEYLRQGDENTEISTGCQCQSLALDSSKRGTRYKTGRKTAQGDKDDTMITIVIAMRKMELMIIMIIMTTSPIFSRYLTQLKLFSL